MKRLFCLILCLILALSLTACGPAPSGPTETAANPFTQGTTTAPEGSANPSQASVSTTAPPSDPAEGPTFPADYIIPDSRGTGIYVHTDSFPEPVEQDPSFVPFPNDYYYRGGEVQIPIRIDSDGYEYAGLGLIAFLDGIPQPFHLNEGEDDQYINVLYLPDGFYEYTVSFLPVTGTVGQWSELWIGLVAGPELVIPDKSYYAYEGRYCGPVGPASIYFRTEPEHPAVPSVENRLISQTISYEPLTYEESVRQPEERRGSDFYSQYRVDDDEWNFGLGDLRRRYGTSDGDTVTIQLMTYDVAHVDYRLVFYYDNQPISIEPMEIVDYQDGEKAIIDTTVDLTGFDGYARLSAYLVPVNVFRSSDGTIVGNNGVNNRIVVDLVLTSAASYDEMYS